MNPLGILRGRNKSSCLLHLSLGTNERDGEQSVYFIHDKHWKTGHGSYMQPQWTS